MSLEMSIPCYSKKIQSRHTRVHYYSYLFLELANKMLYNSIIEIFPSQESISISRFHLYNGEMMQDRLEATSRVPQKHPSVSPELRCRKCLPQGRTQRFFKSRSKGHPSLLNNACHTPHSHFIICLIQAICQGSCCRLIDHPEDIQTGYLPSVFGCLST